MSNDTTRLLTPGGQPARTSFAAYTQRGGYAALQQTLAQGSPEQVISSVRAAGLRGRGGAGVLTAEKLALAARAMDDDVRYVICNAYDADPRSRLSSTLLEQTPHLILEGIALACLAVGAHEAFLYVRASRKEAAAAAQTALREAQEHGVLGHGMLGTPYDLTVTLVGVERGFMGGEESSLIEILKGRPLKAQQRPPYPTEVGYGGHPTVVLNSETVANIPLVLAQGSDAYREAGTEASPGTKLITVVAREAAGIRAQVVEVPFGTTLAQVLARAGVARLSTDIARAVVVGGLEGGVLPLDQLDTPYDYEDLEKTGAIVGSSLIEVLPANTCMVHWAMETTDYLSGESCGKCVPCRVGGKRIAGTLQGLISDLGTESDMALLDEFAHYVADGSLCGFGVNEVNPIATAMRYFGDDFTAHLAGRCPTGTCIPVRSHRFVTKHVL